VCTRQGKALVSRQFVEMNRLRVEGLLAAFPKLLGPHVKQHTFVETDSVRYVYQPLEKNQIYLLLITTKASNIVEDLGTLRLLAKVVPDVAGGLQEHAIQEAAFDLIFAFDEVLTAGGYKEEAVTLASIKTNLLMDSHEEKVYLALKEAKEEETRKQMMVQANKIRDNKIQQSKQALFAGGGDAGGYSSAGGMAGFGGGGRQSSSFTDPFSSSFGDPYNQNPYQTPAAPAVSEAPKVLAKTGMKLGGAAKVGAKSNSLMAAMAAEDNLFGGGAAAAIGATNNAFGLGAPPPKAAAAPSTPLTLIIEEKVSVTMSREGAIESAELKGTLTLTAQTDAGTAALVAVAKDSLPPQFSYATHPKVDKKQYETTGVLQLKGGKSFPVARPIGILRWSYTGNEAAPITINCWPEDDGSGTMTVNIEMELTNTAVVLQDVNIVLPLGTTAAPHIESIDGIYKHDPNTGLLCWHFDVVSAKQNATAALEFSVAGRNADAFFPVQVGFRSETLLCPLQVASVTHAGQGTVIPYQLMQSFSPEVYQCQ
jgi:coatomer subunit delta